MLDARPVIAILTQITDASFGVWNQPAVVLPAGYVTEVQRAGAVAVVLTPDGYLVDHPDELLDRVDGLVLSGGGDIDPAAYGAERHAETSQVIPERDAFELALTRRAAQRDLPILGICRGIQVLNVAFGGTLLQHLPEHVGHGEHRRTAGSFDNNDHDVRLTDGSLAARAAGERVHGTKSHHHQGIDRLGDGLVATGISTLDELVEAVELPGRRFVLGVQWHPEADERSRIIGALVRAAEQGRAQRELALSRMTDDGPLRGRTALVTGASRGIGAATAAALDRAGARVALAARDGERLRAVAAELAHDPVVLEVDLSDPEAPGRLAAAASAGLGGGVDVLVNNAAFAQRLPITAHDAGLIDRMHAVNVRAPLLLIAALVPAMIERGGGSIISLSSVSGLIGTPMRSAYGATKGAIDAASRCLARELGEHSIRVNTVAPGVVDTDLWARNKNVPGVVEQINRQTPLGRWATPEDIADVIVFLASDAARFITGETLRPDGGMSTTLDLYGGNV